MNKFKSPPPLTLGAQFYALKGRYQGGVGWIENHNRTLIWECDLTPAPFSRTYRIRVRYTRGFSPECIVLSPDLNVLANGERIPHTYGDDKLTGCKKLCLYLPKKLLPKGISEWRSQLKLSETIVPWASLWLLYFEDWLFSGEWKGGGAHPSDDENGIYFDE